MGQTVTFTVVLGLAVKVGRVPVLTLNDGGTASYVSGSGTTSLVFTYTVAAGQSAAPLAVTALTLPFGASINASVHGIPANLSGAAQSFSGVVVNTSAPSVVSLIASPANGTLAAGGAITVQVVFSKPVSVTGGTPTLTLSDGAVAHYVSGAGTDRLVFSSTIVPGQYTPDLAVTAFNVNGAAVTDGRGRAADLTGAVGNPTGTLVVSALPVTISAITAVPSVTGPLGGGQTVTFGGTVDRAVVVVGTPVLTLNDGAAARYAATASTATSLVFDYAVAAGQNAASLAVTGLTLNGAAISVPNTPLKFSTPVSYDGGGGFNHYLYDEALADVNGDGIPDLVVSSSVGYPYNVPVLLGDGGGGFAPAYSVPLAPIIEPHDFTGLILPFVTVAGINHYGNPDLLVTSGDGRYAGVLLGDGKWLRCAPAHVDEFHRGGGAPILADVNVDRNLDLVMAAYAPYFVNGVQQTYLNDVISVQLGDGSGGFGAATTFSTVSSQQSITQSIAAADVNGDGKIDIVSVNDDGGIYVQLGDGTGQFGAPTVYRADQTPVQVLVQDLNGDGRPDIAVLNYSSADVSILLANGSGGFNAAVNYAAGISQPRTFAVADVNGDGKPDLLVSDTAATGGVNVLLGDGQGGFGHATTFAAGTQPLTLLVGDLNADGRPDLVTLEDHQLYDDQLNVALNTSAGPNVFDPAGTGTALGADTGLVVETFAPTITADTALPGRGSYDVGQAIAITLTGPEPMLVTGSPVLTLNDGGTASYTSRSGTASLVLRTTIAAGQNAATLGVTGVNVPAGTTIRDGAGNAADLSGTVASFPGLSVVTTPPAVTSVTASPATGSYGIGATITLSVTLNKWWAWPAARRPSR